VTNPFSRTKEFESRDAPFIILLQRPHMSWIESAATSRDRSTPQEFNSFLVMSIHYLADYRRDAAARERATSNRHQSLDLLHWNNLSRPAKKALARLSGGGSLRGAGHEIVQDLRRLGLIDGDERSAQLTRAGWGMLRSSRDWLRN
jgi:hypothetical protein